MDYLLKRLTVVEKFSNLSSTQLVNGKKLDADERRILFDRKFILMVTKKLFLSFLIYPVKEFKKIL